MTSTSLFVSHGAPTMALEPGSAGLALAALGRELPRPRAILVLSAHWDTPVPTVSAASRPDTIHDFHGFPAELYRIVYPASGAPELAQRTTGLLSAAGIPVAVDPGRGLDHGAWVPLRLMYPEADVPVTQLSIQTGSGPAHHLRIGAALAPLLDEGVLVIGSGSMTHNLREVQFSVPEGPATPYVSDFQAWMQATLARGDADALIDYRRLAPGAVRAHPTDEHLLPLFAAYGAAGASPQVRRLGDSVTFRVLAMDAYQFAPVAAAA
jgi:4,5-DOPA dioxygenase extradiol